MSYRYFHKRAHYLAVIMKSLRILSEKKGDLHGVQLEYAFSANDARRSCIVVTAGKSTCHKHSLLHM